MTTLPNGLTVKHRGRERRLADVLEDDVGRVAEDLLDALGEARATLKRAFSSSGVSPPRAHHARELVAVDVVDGAELLDELALLVGGDDADALGAGGLAELRRRRRRGRRRRPRSSTLWPACSLQRGRSASGRR